MKTKMFVCNSVAHKVNIGYVTWHVVYKLFYQYISTIERHDTDFCLACFSSYCNKVEEKTAICRSEFCDKMDWIWKM